MNKMVDKEQESQDITIYKKQLIQWRSLLKHLPKTNKDRDEVGEIDQLISVLKAELTKALPILEAALKTFELHKLNDSDINSCDCTICAAVREMEE